MHDYQRKPVVARQVGRLFRLVNCGYTAANQSDCSDKEKARNGDIPRRILWNMGDCIVFTRHVGRDSAVFRIRYTSPIARRPADSGDVGGSKAVYLCESESLFVDEIDFGRILVTKLGRKLFSAHCQ